MHEYGPMVQSHVTEPRHKTHDFFTHARILAKLVELE